MAQPTRTSRSNPFGVVGVLFDYGLATIAPRAAVRRLVRKLGPGNEDRSEAAYMVLVKLGPRIAAHLLNEARAGSNAPAVLQILGDQGDRRIIPALEEFCDSPDQEIAAAARESEEILRQGDPDSAESS